MVSHVYAVRSYITKVVAEQVMNRRCQRAHCLQPDNCVTPSACLQTHSLLDPDLVERAVVGPPLTLNNLELLDNVIVTEYLALELLGISRNVLPLRPLRHVCTVALIYHLLQCTSSHTNAWTP
jgi:hypothetical protein